MPILRILFRTTSGPFRCCVVLAMWSAAFACAAELYVSPQGDDGYPGTRERPLRTLARARDLLRTDSTRGGTLHLLPGIYRFEDTLVFDERDSGAAEAPMVFRGVDRHAVILSGGLEVPAAACRPLQDESVRARLPPELSEAVTVYEVDLAALGVHSVGEYGPRGFRRPYRPAPLELFVDEEALHVAQWPNRGEPAIPISRVLDPGSNPREGDDSNRGGIIGYEDQRIFPSGADRVSRWSRARRVWLTGYFAWGYADDTVEMAAIDPPAKTIATRQPTMYSFHSDKPFLGWHALNLLEELDRPGEYYADADRLRLYFIPPSHVDLATSRIRVSVLEQPMLAFEGASDIRFENLTIENTRGMAVYIERGERVRFQACTFRHIGMVAVCIGKGTEPLAVFRHDGTAPAASRTLGSWHEHLYANSAANREAGRDHGVIGCEIYSIGAGAISLGGGDRRTLTPAGNFVEDCDIHHYNRLDRSYKAAVNLDGVGNSVRRNRIHDAPGAAVYVHGNDHLIERNEISRCVTDVDDMGAIYFGRDASEQGLVIRANFFHHNGSRIGPYGTQCIFADDGACGALIEGNVFYRNVGVPVKVFKGFDHVVRDNVFIENDGVFFNHGSSFEAWLREQQSELMVKRLHEAVNVFTPPYSERYPRLVRTLTDPADVPRTNDLVGNTIIRSGRIGTQGGRGDRYLKLQHNRYAPEEAVTGNVDRPR